MTLIRNWNDADKKCGQMSVKKKGTLFGTCVDSISFLWSQFENDSSREMIRVHFTPCNEIFKYVIPKGPNALKNHQKSLLNTV